MIPIAHHDTAADAESVTGLVDRFGTAPTLLAVWAHPDDESFLAGGLLAEVTRRGGTVVSVTATAGEHGTDDPVVLPPARLADRRRAELDRALAVLGGGPAVHLHLHDGGCDRIPDRRGARSIGRIVDRIVPDLVLTFGPEGVTGHPDHRAVGRWVRRAIADRGDRIPLVTTAAANVWPADGVDRLHALDAFWPGFPRAVEDDVVVRLDAELLRRKLDAIGCHASQMDRVRAELGPEGLRRLAELESYVPANAAARLHMSPEPALPSAA